MSDKRADAALAGDLHGKLAKLLLDILENGEVIKVVDKETGEVTFKTLTPSPAMVAQINAFLKNNNITVMPGKSKPLVDLSDAFEEFAPPADPEAGLRH